MHNITSAALIAPDNVTQYTRFKENLEYTVIMPGELFHRTPIEATCATSMMIAAALGALLFMSALLVSVTAVPVQLYFCTFCSFLWRVDIYRALQKSSVELKGIHLLNSTTFINN